MAKMVSVLLRTEPECGIPPKLLLHCCEHTHFLKATLKSAVTDENRLDVQPKKNEHQIFHLIHMLE